MQDDSGLQTNEKSVHGVLQVGKAMHVTGEDHISFDKSVCESGSCSSTQNSGKVHEEDRTETKGISTGIAWEEITGKVPQPLLSGMPS